MTYNPDIHHRRSIRLRDYDYAEAGAYFVTICVLNHECLLGDIDNGVMTMNDAGRMVETVWRGLPDRFPSVELDAFVVMPNHVHGILCIHDPVGADLGPPGHGPPGLDTSQNITPSNNQGAASRAPTLGTIICAFKSISAIQINRLLSRPGIPFWQRNYYERVIRNDAELTGIREYIINNPAKWADDKLNSTGKTLDTLIGKYPVLTSSDEFARLKQEEIDHEDSKFRKM